MTDWQPLTVDDALGALYAQAEVAWAVAKRGSDGLSLAGTGDGLETTVDVLDLMLAIVGTLVARTYTIRDRELTSLREGSALDVLDTALVHLEYGKEVLEGSRHLLGMGRGEVLRITRGEV